MMMDNLTERIADLSPAKRALLELRLRSNSSGASGEQSIPRRANRDSAPLSFAQQRLWFLDQLEPGSSSYNVPRAVRMRGALSVEALRQTLEAIVARHESLRTTFASVDESPVQVIAESGPVVMPVVDLSELPASEREAEARRLAADEAQRLFDLAKGPLFRATLLRLGDEDHILLLTNHHIVSDGWSAGVLFREFSVLYEAFSAGKPSPLKELPIQYADYAVWQREWLTGDVLEQQLAYWKRQLAGAPAMLELPTDRPRPAVQSFRGAHQSLVLPRELTRAIKSLGQRQGATLFMTLLAAFQTLLYRYAWQDDIVVGTPAAGRTRAETEGLIGFFLNTLVMRTDLSGDPTFRELLNRVREVALGAYAHQDLPFEKLVEELQPERSLSHTPLFQVMFNLLITGNRIELPGLTAENLSLLEDESKFDLTLYAGERNEEIELYLVYNVDLFDAVTIMRMLRYFQALLEDIAADPEKRISTLSILTATEEEELVGSFNVNLEDI